MENSAPEPAVQRDLWQLPADTRARFFTCLGRALHRRCPYCGHGGVYDGYFSLKERCPTCGVQFAREEGYFLGAYAFNLVFSEFLALVLALVLIFASPLRQAALLWQEVVAIGLAVAFPIIVFPYSRGVWMAIDLALHPPSMHGERELRGNLTQRERPAP